MQPARETTVPSAGPPERRIASKGMPRGAKVYVLLTLALAAAAQAGWWAARPPLPAGNWLLLPFFAAAITVALLFPLSLPPNRKFTVATAPYFATLLLFGPPLAMLAVGSGTLVANLALARQRRRNRWNVLFNVAQKMLTVGAAGLPLLATPLWTAPTATALGLLTTVPAIAVAAAVAYLVNSVSLAFAVWAQRHFSPLHVWLEGVKQDVFADATLYLTGTLAAVVVLQSPWALIALIAPIVVVHQALLQAAHATEEARNSASHEADRLKGELLSVVSHELRTPLGTIKGFVSSLRHYGDRLDSTARDESLRVIDEAADRLTELVDDLLDLQRLEAGRLLIAHETVDLEAVVAAAMTALAPRVHGHHLDLIAHPNLPPVEGDARRLRQVVQNLLDNALKYSPEGGQVRVRLDAHDDRVELRVEDEGIGIPSDHLGRVFERFHRVESALTRSVGGTGLGLTIVRELVTAHGGSVRAESPGPGRGSTFVVTLPANGHDGHPGILPAR